MLKYRKRLSRPFDGEDDNENPMDSLTNLFDVMLVFACGLMVALVMSLNVDYPDWIRRSSNIRMTVEEKQP